MGSPLKLEEFEPDARPPGHGAISPAAPQQDEAALRGAYEQGYAAGWEDAVRASEEENTRISAEFAHNLQDISFTYHEAKSHVLRSVAPLISALVDKLFPELIRETLAERIIQEIEPIASDAADSPVEIALAPDSLKTLENILPERLAHPFELREEPSLSPGQVWLRSARGERLVDLDTALERIRSALQAIETANKEDIANG